MNENKFELTQQKYKLPYHWMRDPLDKDSLPYLGYTQIVLNELPPVPAHVLDAGCGSGRITSEFVKQGYEVTGIDFLETNIFYARVLVPGVNFIHGDLRQSLVDNCNLQKELFDAAVMVEVYEHIPPQDCAQVLANIRDVLKPGGRFIISVPANTIPVSQLHYRHFEIKELEAELQSAGFHINKIIYQHRVDAFTNWLLNGGFDKLVNNRWVMPVILKRWRRRWYFSHANIVNDVAKAGRYIAVATREG